MNNQERYIAHIYLTYLGEAEKLARLLSGEALDELEATGMIYREMGMTELGYDGREKYGRTPFVVGGGV